MAHSPSLRPARLLLAGLLATLTASTLVAQTTRTCRDSNAYCRTLDTSGTPNANDFAIEQAPDSLGKDIVGLSLYAKSVSGTQTVPIYIYRGTSGSGPSGGPIGRGTIQVGPTLQWYKGQFQQPVTIPANVTYFVGLNSRGILHPRCQQTDAPLAYYWRNPIMPSWVGPRTSDQWAFREECSGGAPTAKVSPFGTACPGTGITPLSRFSPNLPCSRPTSYEWPVQTAIEVPKSDQPYTIRRIGLPTVAKGQAITVTVRVLAATSGGEPGAQLTSVPIPVTVNRGMQSATLATPYAVPANTQIFLAFDAQGIDIPNCTDNHIRLRSWQLYSTGWLPGQLQPWSYLIEADGSPDAFADLRSDDPPRIGTTARLTLSGARANAPVAMFVGTSNTTWSGQSLPIDLSPIGAGGCSLLVAADVVLPLKADGIGQSVVPVALPNQVWLAGQRIYAQGVTVDARANQVGITTTNGLDIYIGR